ncbi:MAG: hypothetical protein PSV18_15780 [Methylobacter sp.]|uniref:hypothetical protein n=1 Tax=Methylobacter sp. G7 TaxID=3230117 RepID=UPI002488B9FB|nr:hypothetical protein [Candidatus Methylobacter titanis]
MRTSIDIDDQLLLHAKHQAVQQGCTLKQILEDALRDFFSHQSSSHEPVRLETFSGPGLKPGVNLDNNRSLNDIMAGY